jgi:hypothetical protein
MNVPKSKIKESIDRTMTSINKNYLKNTKDLREKHDQFILKQTHYI